MHSPVPLAIAKLLSERANGGVAWARFNFRGVGASEGTYDGGRGEVDDVRAVTEHLRARTNGTPITLCGHSFGSWVALRAAGSFGGAGPVDRAVLIAPSVRFFGFGEDATLFAGYKAVFIGEPGRVLRR